MRGRTLLENGEEISAIFLTESMTEREVDELLEKRYPAPPPEEPKKDKEE